MTPTQNFDNYPEFENAGQKSQPADAKYSAGFIPSDVLPAEWLNWFLNGATKGVTALNTGVKSVEQEINTVLESRSVTPSINEANQLLTVLNKIKAEAVLAAHPVGSLYWTSKNENPAVTFGGGTWKQITDKFVLAAGSTYKAESAGGSANITLTVANLPSHSHTFTPSGTIKMSAHSHGLNGHTHSFTPQGSVSSTFTGSAVTTGKMSANSVGTFGGTDGGLGNNNVNFRNGNAYSEYKRTFDGNGSYPFLYKVTINVDHVHSVTAKGTVSSSFTGITNTTDGNSGNTTSTTSSGTFKGSSSSTNSTGSGSAFNIMPPYIVKYCWERTA